MSGEPLTREQLVSLCVLARDGQAVTLTREAAEAILDVIQGEAAAEARLAEAYTRLADIHDALHASCDGSVPLPTEIRALRAKLAEAERGLNEAKAHAEGSKNVARGAFEAKWKLEDEAGALAKALAAAESREKALTHAMEVTVRWLEETHATWGDEGAIEILATLRAALAARKERP